MLEISRLTASYGARKIIPQLNLHAIEKGQLTAIIGPNGAGKSTLLKAIAGITSYQGSILLAGKELQTMAPRERASHISFMPQLHAIRSKITVLEALLNVCLMTSVYETDGIIRHNAMELLDSLDLAHLALAPLNTLSGGQYQMASLAQTLVTSGDVVLLDEPISALDIAHQLKVMNKARSVARNGRVVVVVLHDLAFAIRYADRIIVLKEGQLVADGNPEHAITSDLLKTVYNVHATVEKNADGEVNIRWPKEIV
ncbi:ABC transporter ATP-binding protein [Brucellaceae bacterium C25G]